MSYIELFEIEGGKLIPTKHCYTLDFLKAVMDKYPKTYIKIYEYIQYTTCPYPVANPFFNIAEEERETEVLRHIKLETSLDDVVITTAKEGCAKLWDSRMAQAYKAMAIGVENIAAYIRVTKPSDGRDGNLASLLKAIEHYPKMREAFDKVETAFLESQKSTRTRGGEDTAYDLRSSR